MSARLILPLALLMLAGCVRTVASVVTAPVRAVGWTADKLTTSQSEADQKRGRREREAEEKIGREQRKQERAQRRQAERDGPY